MTAVTVSADTAASANIDGSGATICFAGVDEELRSAIHLGLEPYGHRVLDTGSDAEVIAASMEQQADVVLLDVDCFNGNRWEVLDRLHDGPMATANRPPVVLITSETDDASVLDGMRHGAHDQVSKPIRTATLIARVEAALRAKRLGDQLIAEHRRAVQMSGIDMITGMPSRARMEEMLAQNTAIARRYGYPISVILIDLDHFTRINDVHGTEAGNVVLHGVGEHISADLRTSDIAGRWGDDEFLLVLPHTPVDGAMVLANRLQMTLSEIPIRLPGGAPTAVPASFGCAEGAEPLILMQQADEMLREAKRSGRNTVRSAR